MDLSNFIVEFIFFSNLFLLINALLFWKKLTARIFLFNCSCLCLIFLPEILTSNGFIINNQIKILFFIGVSFFPIAFVLMIRNFIKGSIKTPFILLTATSAITFVISALFYEKLHLFYSAFYMLFSIYMLFLFPGYTSNYLNRYTLIKVGLLVTFLTSLYSFIQHKTFYSYSLGLLFTLTTIFYITKLYHKSILLSRHLQKAKELNRQMIHENSRLLEKANQLKKFLKDKDLELLQMSKHASLAEITTGIAHELAQPLTGIKGLAQNMMDDINYNEFDNHQAVSELTKISSLVDKASIIIEHIRNFSGKGGINLQSIDLNRAILNAVELINVQFKKQNIELMLNLNEDIKNIYGDIVSLEQLIINLLLNGRDAILEKRKTEEEFQGMVSISSDVIEDAVKLEINDNGIGIPPDIIKKIWAPFFTTKQRTSGTGVGLSVCRKILKEHRAVSFIESSPGSGTIFIMKFPTRKDNNIVTIA